MSLDEFMRRSSGKTGEWKRPVTEQEFAVLVEAVAERIRNVVYMQAEGAVLKIFDQIGVKVDEPLGAMISPQSQINISYDIMMVGMDLGEIVGGVRRKAKQARRKA